MLPPTVGPRSVSSATAARLLAVLKRRDYAELSEELELSRGVFEQTGGLNTRELEALDTLRGVTDRLSAVAPGLRGAPLGEQELDAPLTILRTLAD